MNDERLTTEAFWRDSFWKIDSADLPDVTFDPENLEFRHVHHLLREFLPGGKCRCLEVGCTPGRYLWYFWKQFGYDVTGIEYVEEAAAASRQALKAAGVPATVLHADLFTFEVPPNERFDVVFSFGVVEHFNDVRAAVAKHAALVAPGGTLVIFVPNHVGLHGALLRAIDPKLYSIHNRMNLACLKEAAACLDDFEILRCGYMGHFNLAPSNFLPWLRQKVPYRIYRVVEILHNKMLQWNGILPETALLSPLIGVIARRTKSSE